MVMHMKLISAISVFALVATLIPFAQGFKIAAGLAQASAALWFTAKSSLTRMNMAFALAFGANGLAFAIWNFGRPGSRTPHSLTLEGRGVLDWIATLALVLFALFFLQLLERARTKVLVLPLILAATMLASDIYKARDYHLDLLAFGGLAIYVATAFALALLALIFAAELRWEIREPCTVFSTALSVNYADHIGTSLIRSGAAPPATIQLGGMRWGVGADVPIEVAGLLFIVGVWLWNFRTSDKARAALAVVLCLVASFLAGVFVRLVAGNYRAVQESGFFGFGLVAASALLIYARRARGLFFSPQSDSVGDALRGAAN